MHNHTHPSLNLKELNVSRETFERLKVYMELLEKWNKSINLISRKIPINHLINHINEAVFLGSALPEGSKIIDIGSGNGLPGIILGIMNFENILVERNSKKAIFLKEAVRILGIKSQVINADVRDCYDLLAGFKADFIVSKAVSTTLEIINLCFPIITEKTEVCLLKSTSMLEEVFSLKEKYHFESVVIENKNVADSVILKVRSIKLKK